MLLNLLLNNAVGLDRSHIPGSLPSHLLGHLPSHPAQLASLALTILLNVTHKVKSLRVRLSLVRRSVILTKFGQSSYKVLNQSSYVGNVKNLSRGAFPINILCAT